MAVIATLFAFLWPFTLCALLGKTKQRIGLRLGIVLGIAVAIGFCIVDPGKCIVLLALGTIAISFLLVVDKLIVKRMFRLPKN